MGLIKVRQDWGFGELSSVPDQPLPMRRALRGILEEGKPQGAARWLFFQPNLTRPEVFWLGSLLLTRANRVVFFPPSQIPAFRMFHHGSVRPGRGFDVDHVTLEPDWQSWHVTGTNRRHRSAGPRTIPLRSGGVIWFGMNSAGPEILERVRQSNVIEFEVPDSDLVRRKRLLEEVRAEAVDQIVSLNPLAFTMQPPWSVQFNFLIGPPGFSVTDEEVARFYVGPEDLKKGEIRFQTFSRHHRVRLTDELEVLLATFPIPGEAKDRWSLMAWG